MEIFVIFLGLFEFYSAIYFSCLARVVNNQRYRKETVIVVILRKLLTINRDST